MAKATVKWFDTRKGFGFVINEQGQEVFVHYTGIDRRGFRCLRKGQVVEYEQLDTEKGFHGKAVRILETKAPSAASVKTIKTPDKKTRR